MDNYKYLMADCVIFEDYCNLRCQYCFLPNDFKVKINSDDMRKYQDGMEKIIHIVHQMNIPIIKFSGGEIFLIEGLMDILKGTSGFERVQVLTNGTLFSDKIIDDLTHVKNLCIQVTLDGHTYEMNKYRFPSEKMFLRVVDSVNALLGMNIPIEINLCLTNNNIAKLREFIEYLLNLNKNNITLYPIPVRERELKYGVYGHQLNYLDEIIQNYTVYKRVLPPYGYFTNLCEMLRNRRKSEGWICSIPELVIGVQGNGDIKICPEVSTEEKTLIGNLFSDNIEEIVPFRKKSLALLLKTKCRVVPLCQGCYTHYEVINLFMNKVISYDELSNIWFFNNELIYNYLNNCKEGKNNG